MHYLPISILPFQYSVYWNTLTNITSFSGCRIHRSPLEAKHHVCSNLNYNLNLESHHRLACDLCWTINFVLNLHQNKNQIAKGNILIDPNDGCKKLKKQAFCSKVAEWNYGKTKIVFNSLKKMCFPIQNYTTFLETNSL